MGPIRPTLAVFASDRGPGDAERASIMSQAGSYFARRGARILCLADNGSLPAPLITSARAAGGEIIVIADRGFKPPSALAGLAVEQIADPEHRLQRIAELATIFVGLPGSLVSASNLYRAWVRAGGGSKPAVFYNRKGAFEVVRGFAADVIAHGIHHHDHHIQFSDSIEDTWHKINWLLNERRARETSQS